MLIEYIKRFFRRKRYKRVIALIKKWEKEDELTDDY